MDERKVADATVTATPAPHSRLVWPVAAGILVIGLLLLNVDTIGRMAIDAHDAMRLRKAERGQAARQVAAGGDTARSAPAVPAAAAIMPPGQGNVAMPADDATAALAALPERPLERLYAAPAAAPPMAAPVQPRPAADGRAGLVMLVRAGALRPVSGNALARWKASYATNNSRPVGARFDEWIRTMPVYEIVGDMTFPGGLGGANAAVFLLGERAPYPAGDPGHSVILDSASGSCIGVTCGMLLGRE